MFKFNFNYNRKMGLSINWKGKGWNWRIVCLKKLIKIKIRKVLLKICPKSKWLQKTRIRNILNKLIKSKNQSNSYINNQETKNKVMK